MEKPFRDRTEAGRLLAHKLRDYAGRSDVLVLALPRGGVPVAFEVARALGAPLDIFMVRKLGVPVTRNWRWEPLPVAVFLYSTKILFDTCGCPMRLLTLSLQKSSENLKDANLPIAVREPCLKFETKPSYWLTMGLPQVRQCVPPSRRSGNNSRHNS
jgi:hypothetical protein